MSLYEAHITYDASDRSQLESCKLKGWKFSAIDGDPILGPGRFCYLTSHDSDAHILLVRMVEAVKALGLKSVRQKIERVVYDTKSGVDELTWP